MIRLLLVRHGRTTASAARRFPADEPLDDAGARAAAALRGRFEGVSASVSSPARRCLETAAAAGLEPRVEPRLSECQFGSWAGSTLAQIDARDPAAARRWMCDPDARPHGGESLRALHRRVGEWLADIAAEEPGTTVAVTHAGVIKSAVVHVVRAPLIAHWRIAAAPLSVTELVQRDGWWEIRRLGWSPGPYDGPP